MFLAPAFLFGLLAIGVPVWLHRVARANPTRHRFASLMLLEASETQKTAQRILRYWLLLALRIALLIAVVLAFAGPLLSSRAVPTVNPNARLHAIVLDTSLSMQYGERWKQALAEANAILDGLNSSDRVMLVAGAGRRIQVVQEAVNANEAGLVKAAMASVKPGIDRLDYGLLMMTSKGWLGEPRLPTELHLISDLQQTASPLRFADLEPPAETRIVIHDVGAGEAANVFVEDVTMATLDSRALEVRVGTTAAAAEGREVVLSIDGKEHARRRIDFKAAAVNQGADADRPTDQSAAVSTTAAPTVSASQLRTETVQFPDLQLTSGTHRIEVSLQPNDALPQDDRFYSAIEHADPKVMLITRKADTDETAYFTAAIESLTAPRLSVEQGSSQDAEARPMTEYSAMVIADTAVLSPAAVTRIREYIGAGGAVLATLGTGATSDSIEPLSGLRIRDVLNQPTMVGVIEASHAALRDASDWHSVRFFRHVRVETGDQDRVLIALDNGAPLLIERTMGAGRMLLLTAPLDRDWNDLAIHPLFVRFVAEVARYITGQDAAASSARVGSAVLTGLTATSGGQIFDPQGRRVFELAETAAADRLIPDQTGFYEVRSGAGVRWIAVNIDARESDLSRLPPQSVRRWEALRAAGSPQRVPTAQAAAASSPEKTSDTSRSLGYWLLLLAAVLVLLELLLGNHYLAVRREVPG